MSIDDFCYSDNMKILRFIDEMIVEPADFRCKVLDLFSDIFNYDKTTFWLIDDSKDIHSPLVKNLDDEAIDKYMEGYYRDDFFHPENMNKNLVLKKTFYF
ncbi:hypothetical protein SAMN02745751_01351 [Dethiosulfatibacter aminovorans DSM 17477]|uniref:Uncharacterized protein n=1 Tax=Dethiosulfatibacter aminovorans DSM 17477 TaxID=1121476 RepID=A0A1M6F4V9_9FIRM|nr:hypothetical protein [Dethiosulfatibacter aminovorans]SHI92629.1 hypothetical protein SAMN02745751_01351 [Dethiosulfatibacter aminovorans DSM 17477]